MQNESKAARECKHPFVWPDGNCVQCGVLATTMPGHTEPTHVMVPRKFEPLIREIRSAAIEDAAQIVENSCPCRKCGDTPRTVAEDVRSLKGNL